MLKAETNLLPAFTAELVMFAKAVTAMTSKAGWGELKSGAGWISLDHVEKIRE